MSKNKFRAKIQIFFKESHVCLFLIYFLLLYSNKFYRGIVTLLSL